VIDRAVIAEAAPGADPALRPAAAHLYWGGWGAAVGAPGEQPLDIKTPPHAGKVSLALAGLAVATSAMRLFAAGQAPTDLFHGGLLIAGGAALLVYGFVLLHKKRVLENVPRSRIRSVAMGFAEITGMTRVRTPVVAPLSGMGCVFYRFLVEEEQSDGRGGSSWRRVDGGQSAEWFVLDDGTGSVVVDPDGAEADLGRDYLNIDRGPGVFGRRRRLSEWRLHAGERALVAGTVRPLRDAAQERRESVHDRLVALKHDPARLAAFDADHDGRISTEEWGNAVRVVENEVVRAAAAAPRGPAEDDRIIARGESERTFVISDKGEEWLVRSLGWKSGLAVLAGAGIIVAGALALLSRAGAGGPGLFLSR